MQISDARYSRGRGRRKKLTAGEGDSSPASFSYTVVQLAYSFGVTPAQVLDMPYRHYLACLRHLDEAARFEARYRAVAFHDPERLATTWETKPDYAANRRRLAQILGGGD